MATYFVRKTGNDTTGDGSTGNPWLTVDKAAQTIPIAGGHTVKIGAGTYGENSGSQGYLNVNRVFTSEVIFESETGNPADVVIQGASHVTLNTFTNAANKNWHFRNLTLGARLPTSASSVRLTQTTGFKLTNVLLQVPSDASGPKYGVQIQPSGATAVADVVLDTVVADGGANANGFAATVDPGATGTITNVTLRNCNLSGALPLNVTVAGNAAGVLAGLDIDGGAYNGTAGYGIKLGQDSDTAVGTIAAPKIRNAIISTAGGTGHAFLIGKGADDAEITSNLVVGADFGGVIKGARAKVRNNTFRGGAVNVTNGSAVYLKGAVDTLLEGNTLYSNRGIRGTMRIGPGDTSGSTLPVSTGWTRRGNRVVADGAGIRALEVVAGSDNGTSDSNIYDLRNGANYGDVRGVNGITTLAGLRAAWSGSAHPANDANSIDAADAAIIEYNGAGGDALYTITTDYRGWAWNGTTFEPQSDANRGTYARRMFEEPAGRYTDFLTPLITTRGTYRMVVLDPAGYAPAPGDATLKEQFIEWPPADPLAVTWAEAKDHLRLDTDDERAYVETLIDAAVDYAETRLGAILSPRTVGPVTFYDGARIQLRPGPLVSITSVVDANGAPVTGYEIRRIGTTDEIVLSGSSAAAAAAYPITVTWTAGYATLPASIRLAILQHVATLYENRESVSDREKLPVPHALADFYRLKSRAVGVG